MKHNHVSASSRRVLLAFLALGMLVLPQAAFAKHFWTTVGSAGIVDESSLGLYATNGFALTYGPTSALDPITARYNITETFVQAGTGENPGWSAMDMRSNAPPNSTVTAFLTRVNPRNGTTASLCTITNPGNGLQLQHCVLHEGFDFATFVYYITVTLSRTNASAVPSVGTLRMF